MPMRLFFALVMLVSLTLLPGVVPVWAEVEVQNESSEHDPSIEKLRRIRAQVEDGAGKVSTGGGSLSQRDHDSEGDLLSRGVQGLMLCLGIFFVIVYFLKKNHGSGGAQQKRRVRLLEQQTLAPKASVALLTIDGRELLIGIAEGGISLLQELNSEKCELGVLPEQEREELEEVYQCING